MSGQSSCQYLLFYLFASTILVHGSLQKSFKRSCPSCSQDNPEALTVQLPWDVRKEANLQSNERNLPINSPTNSFYSTSTQEEISKNAARSEDIPSNQYPLYFGNRRISLQREPVSEDFEHLNTFPKYLNKRNFLSPDSGKLASEYSHPFRTRQNLDITKNTVLKNLRNKFSESMQDRRPKVPIFHAVGKHIPASAVPVSYRVDRNFVPSLSHLRDASNILPQQFHPRDISTFRHRRGNEEEIAMKKSTSPHNSFQLPVTYNPTGFNLPEVKRDTYNFPPEDLNIRAPMTDVLFRNWDTVKDSLKSSKLAREKLNLAKTDFSETYREKEGTIFSKMDNEQINPYTLSLDSRTNPSKNEEFFDWKLTRKNSLESTEMERSEATDNWPLMYSTIGKNTRHFEDDEDEKSEHFADEDEFYRQLFGDEDENDTITIERGYDPYIRDTNNWGKITNVDHKDLFDMPDFSSIDLQALQEASKLEIYPEENNSELFRDNEDVILEDEAYTNRLVRPPVINGNNAYIIPRAIHTLNNAKYPVKSLGIQEASENKDNISHANFVGKKDNGIYEDKTIMQNNMNVESSIFSKNNMNAETYPVTDTQNMKNNAQDEIFTRLDPDLLDDVETPPTESIKSLPESSNEFSTSRQQ